EIRSTVFRLPRQASATRSRGVPKREATAMPTATMDAIVQTTPPTKGTSDTAASAANPDASATGRRGGETLWVSFFPRRRKRPPMPKIVAATATNTAASATGIEIAAGRRASAAAAARNRVTTARIPAASDADQSLSAAAAARANGEPKK